MLNAKDMTFRLDTKERNKKEPPHDSKPPVPTSESQLVPVYEETAVGTQVVSANGAAVAGSFHQNYLQIIHRTFYSSAEYEKIYIYQQPVQLRLF